MQPDVSDSEDEDRFGVFDRRYDSSPTAEDFQETGDLLGEESHRLSEADRTPTMWAIQVRGFARQRK